LKLVGPFDIFRLKVGKDTQQPKGYGFCEYKDPDVAASALRNLDKIDLNRRELKVDFATDNKNGTNLRKDDVNARDKGEIVNAKGQVLTSNDSSMEDLLAAMTPE